MPNLAPSGLPWTQHRRPNPLGPDCAKTSIVSEALRAERLVLARSFAWIAEGVWVALRNIENAIFDHLNEESEGPRLVFSSGPPSRSRGYLSHHPQ